MHKSFLAQLTCSHKKPLTVNRQRLFLWLFICSLTLLSACSVNKANAYNYSIKPRNLDNSEALSATSKINILSSFLITSKSINSFPIVELSGLTWDADEQLLYAISDEGLLYHLTLGIRDNKLKSVNIIAAMPLKDKQKKALKGKFSDAEGLSLINGNNGKRGDSQLIISFENKPRITLFSPTGHFIKKVKTVEKLRKRKYFRGNNKALESVTSHPTYGILTAAERPLKANPIKQQTVYSSEGKEWHFASSKVKNSSITAIEVISENKILILERAYNGLLSPVVISLRQLNIDKCNAANFCETESLARLDTSEGWILDNFEGLTHLRDNQYLMVSDNNKNPLQKTFLVLFEVLEK